MQSQHDNDSNSNNSQSKKINTNDGHTTKATRIVRECISMNQFDIDMINEIATKSAAEGQRTSKSDIYRASVKYFSKLFIISHFFYH